MPWRYPESFMEFPDCKERHLLRLLIPDLILGLILDLPKCAEQGSRCSLSLVFILLACLKITYHQAVSFMPAGRFLQAEGTEGRSSRSIARSTTEWVSGFVSMFMF